MASRDGLAAMIGEQVGFVSDAILRLYSYKSVPDVSSITWKRTWFEFELARMVSLSLLVAHCMNARLSAVLARRYRPGADGRLTCWHCGDTECTCQLIIAPHDISVEDLLRALRT
jgi:hypothetical protein